MGELEEKSVFRVVGQVYCRDLDGAILDEISLYYYYYGGGLIISTVILGGVLRIYDRFFYAGTCFRASPPFNLVEDGNDYSPTWMIELILENPKQ